MKSNSKSTTTVRRNSPAPASDIEEIVKQANALIQQNRFKEALVHLEQGCRLKHDSVDLHSITALLFVRQEDYTKAEEYFQRALSLSPENNNLIHNLALLYTSQGKLDQAVECFSKIADLEPDNSDVCNDLATIENERGNIESAEQYFQQAMAKPDCTQQIFFNYFEFSLSRQRYDNGFAAYEVFNRQWQDDPIAANWARTFESLAAASHGQSAAKGAT